MSVHWAKSMDDQEEIACGGYVGPTLMEGEDVTEMDAKEFLTDPEACPDCKDALEKQTQDEH